ncbi:MAG: ABC transporter ATP-binding protein [Methanomassiliicoccales archaeon]|nr:MAG: ABC transporter ATP-binding protein [Methanomassiliicoccales archaeon]
MDDTVFKLDNVSLTFNLIKRFSLISGSWASSKIINPGPIHALRSVTLTITKGHKIGIIGRNGAGKTSLLRLLAGVYEPTDGTIIINSNRVSLLTLGVGFDANASGLDNIYLGALLNGLTKKEIDKIVDSIIEFSELEEHIYYPFKTYSTGMKSRLAFSIAIHSKPEVLLLDEVLSVGDFEFQKKSWMKMQEFINTGNRTVIVTSHNLETIKQICDQVIWLDRGSVIKYGCPEEVISAYCNSSKKNAKI